MLQVWRGYLPKDFIVPKSPERILYCGWRRDMEDMIMVMLEESTMTLHILLECNFGVAQYGGLVGISELTSDFFFPTMVGIHPLVYQYLTFCFFLG